MVRKPYIENRDLSFGHSAINVTINRLTGVVSSGNGFGTSSGYAVAIVYHANGPCIPLNMHMRDFKAPRNVLEKSGKTAHAKSL